MKQRTLESLKAVAEAVLEAGQKGRRHPTL